MLETMRPTSKIHLQTDDRLSPLIPIEPAHDSDAIIAHYAKVNSILLNTNADRRSTEILY